MPKGIYKKPGYNGSPQERFWKYVDKNGDDDCWVWVGKNKTVDGYGVIKVKNKSVRTHRFSYELHISVIPSGQSVPHRCDVPPCVNPNHLFLGTQKENIADMCKKGRNASHLGEKNPKAKVTWDIVKEIREASEALKSYKYRSLSIELSKKFNISVFTINEIIRMKTWKI